MKRGFFLPFARDGKKGKEKRNFKSDAYRRNRRNLCLEYH